MVTCIALIIAYHRGLENKGRVKADPMRQCEILATVSYNCTYMTHYDLGAALRPCPLAITKNNATRYRGQTVFADYYSGKLRQRTMPRFLAHRNQIAHLNFKKNRATHASLACEPSSASSEKR